MDVPEGFQIPDLRAVARRRGPLALALAGAIALASIVVAAVLPSEYEAFAVLLVQPQSIARSIVDSGGEVLELNQRLAIMEQEILAPSRLSSLIDEFGLYLDESKEMTRMEVVLLMRDHIQLEPVVPELEEQVRTRNSEVEINTFLIRYRSESAELAAAVANSLADAFVGEHIEERINVSESTREFISGELLRIQNRLGEVEAQMATIEEEFAGRLPSDLDTNQRLLERTTDELRRQQADLAAVDAEVAFYRQQLAQANALGASSGSGATTPAQRLDVLRVELTALEARGLTEKHPDIIATRLQIAQLESELFAAAEPATEETQSGPRSLAQMAAEAELQRATARAEALRRDIARLSSEAVAIEARIAETPRVEERLAALQREHLRLSEKQRDYGSKQVDAEVALRMERRQKGEQVRVLARAFTPPEPARPNRSLIVVLGILFGLAIGGGAAVLLESTDATFYTARPLQAALRVPVLASIPEIVLEADRAARRRRHLFVTAATLLVVGFALTGAAAGYMFVNGTPGWVKRWIDSPPAASAPAAPTARAS